MSDEQTGYEPLERLVPVLVDRLPLLLTEVGQLLGEQWPDYARFLEEEHEEVSAAAEAFMHWLVRIAEHDQGSVPEAGPHEGLFEEIGRIEWREGRELSTLLSAYHVGARAAWHYVSRTALEAHVAPGALAALAEAVFAFVDQLSSASARGYVLEQSDAAIARERLRDKLVDLLLSDRSDSSAVRDAAQRAGWSLPRSAAVILLDADNPVGPDLLGRLDHSCLRIHRPGVAGTIVPDPDRPGRRRQLTGALRGTGAVIGHTVPTRQLPASLRLAEIAMRIQATGVIDDDPMFVDQHLDAIIVHRDPWLLERLRAQCLAPLAGSSPATRDRLCQTLTSWLRHQGDRQAMAAELHIHPQTVRYRMSQLHALFGSALADPTVRGRLTLALAWGTGEPVPPEYTGGAALPGAVYPPSGTVAAAPPA